MSSKTAAGLAAAAMLTLFSMAHAVVPDFPTISGPVPDPDPVLGPMFPGIRPLPPGTDLADFNYVTEEYWISGTACNNAYKTRIVIRRPSDMSKFSGVVVAEPLHRGGNSLIFLFTHWGTMSRGHIGLEIDARVINLNNANNALQSLQPFNSTRYGSVGNTNPANGFALMLTGQGAQANEILAQVGRLIKDTSEPTNPLKDWPIQKIVMAGTSDSSDAVRLYLAGTSSTSCNSGSSVGHATFRMPDGGPIYDGFFRGSILNTTPTPALTDGVPHIEMPTQFELHSSSGFRKADSDAPDNRYALQEQAGSSHNDTRDNAGFIASFPGGQTCDGTLSRFHFGANYFRGLQQLIDWTYGITPPAAPRMAQQSTLVGCTFNGNTYTSRVLMDSFCNAMGGVRTPYLDVPLFRYRIPNTGSGSLCNQTSDQQRFPDDVIASLYANPRQYLGKWKRRLNELVQQRWVMPEYVDFIRADAKEFLPAGARIVVWRNSATGENYVYPIDSATSLGFLRVDSARPTHDKFAPAIQASEGYLRTVPDANWQIVGKGDFDGDGKDDILWRNSSTGQNYIYFLDGATLKPTEGFIRTVADLNWQVAGVGDFDGDGKDDILWRNAATGENYIYMMNGLIIQAEGSLRTVDLNWNVAGIGDFDNDGKADILWRNSATGQNYVYPMDARQIKPNEGYLRTVADQNWQVAGVGDFDGDGSADIFWRNAVTGENYVYPMNGTTILPGEGYVRTVADQNWQIVAAGDFDGDGIDDVLWRNASTGENYIYPMHGTAIKGNERSIRTVADQNWQVKR